MKTFLAAFVCLIISACDATVCHGVILKGRVYLDGNQNGRLDSGDARTLVRITVPRDQRPTTKLRKQPHEKQPESGVFRRSDVGGRCKRR